MSSWANAISLTGRPGPFENLKPVAEYTSQVPWEPFDEKLLSVPMSEAVARDPYPLPSAPDREGYHGDRHFEHWLSGLRDHLLLVKRLAQHDIRLAPGDSVLDFGCASGRVMRHFLCQSPGLDLWGADINHRNIEWIRRFLAPTLKVFQSTALPQLPLEDRSMALVYAYSVFTHIDELELAWLLELRRILRPGGIAYLTVHTENTWEMLAPNIPLYHAILRLAPDYPEWKLGPDTFKRPMGTDRLVFAAKTGKAYNVNIFQTTEYLRTTWGRFFEILDFYRAGANYQDVIMLRKR